MTFCIEARNRVSECVHLCVCLQIVASFCLPRGIFRENIQQRVVRYKCFEARRQTPKTHQRSLPRAAQGLGLTASMEDGMHRMHLAIRPSRLQSVHSSQCAAEPSQSLAWPAITAAAPMPVIPTSPKSIAWNDKVGRHQTAWKYAEMLGVSYHKIDSCKIRSRLWCCRNEVTIHEH